MTDTGAHADARAVFAAVQVLANVAVGEAVLEAVEAEGTGH